MLTSHVLATQEPGALGHVTEQSLSLPILAVYEVDKLRGHIKNRFCQSRHHLRNFLPSSFLS